MADLLGDMLIILTEEVRFVREELRKLGDRVNRMVNEASVSQVGTHVHVIPQDRQRAAGAHSPSASPGEYQVTVLTEEVRSLREELRKLGDRVNCMENEAPVLSQAERHIHAIPQEHQRGAGPRSPSASPHEYQVGDTVTILRTKSFDRNIAFVGSRGRVIRVSNIYVWVEVPRLGIVQ